jgi:hypothetical protein
LESLGAVCPSWGDDHQGATSNLSRTAQSEFEASPASQKTALLSEVL